MVSYLEVTTTPQVVQALPAEVDGPAPAMQAARAALI